MTLPLLPSHDVGMVLAVLIGFAFGFVLERAGFGSAPKLAAQFYGHDLTVFKVMFSAIVTAMLGAVVLGAAGWLDFRALADGATSQTFLWPMLLGGVALGVGFILSGYCPGTAFVAAASGKLDGVAAVVGVIAGQFLYASMEHLEPLRTLHHSGALGNLYLWELFGLPAGYGPAAVAAGVVVMAVGCFLGAEWLERHLRGGAIPAATPRAAGPFGKGVFASFVVLASVGITLAVVRPVAVGAPFAAALVDPATLARRVFTEPWSLRILDLRAEADCLAGRVPGASCVPEERLEALGLAWASSALDLVLIGAGAFSEVPAAAAQYPGRVLVLDGGHPAWARYALEPPAPPPPDADPAELQTWAQRAAIRDALTGQKAAPPPPPPAVAPPKKGKGGGCG
jgi:hypothetical protein